MGDSMKNVLGFFQARSLVLPVFAVLGLTLAGCAGDDMGSTDTEGTTAATNATNATNATDATSSDSETGSTSDGTDTTTTVGAVGYEADIQPIWDAKCVEGCHIDGGSKPDLPLNAGVSHGAIVGVASQQLVSMNMVEPGDVEKSYLWYKLNNTQADVGGMGLSMPLGMPLDEADMAKIEAWINSGAEM